MVPISSDINLICCSVVHIKEWVITNYGLHIFIATPWKWQNICFCHGSVEKPWVASCMTVSKGRSGIWQQLDFISHLISCYQGKLLIKLFELNCFITPAAYIYFTLQRQFWLVLSSLLILHLTFPLTHKLGDVHRYHNSIISRSHGLVCMFSHSLSRSVKSVLPNPHFSSTILQ